MRRKETASTDCHPCVYELQTRMERQRNFAAKPNHKGYMGARRERIRTCAQQHRTRSGSQQPSSGMFKRLAEVGDYWLVGPACGGGGSSPKDYNGSTTRAVARDAATDPDLGGYRVCPLGTASVTSLQVQTVGSEVTTYDVTGPNSGTRFYFIATTDMSKRISIFLNDVSKDIP